MRRTKILLVDDKPENILALESLIAAADTQILSAGSGNDALALLLDHEFALALIDVQMPVINGFELARLMRGAERSRAIPIIFVTAARSTADTIFEGYEKGAVDFLFKPLDAHIVRSKVRVFIELDQKSQALKEKLGEVEKLRDAAESASLAKSRFLANMSHEIRTPLGAVLGFAELLQYRDQSASDHENCVNAILRNGHHLLKLVDDILDLSKIEAERVEAECIEASLTELVADLRAVHAHNASERGIHFSVQSDGTLPRVIRTDPLRIRQILNNVVGNAVKFTSDGRVDVTVAMKKQANGSAALSFVVTDTGIGLAAGERERLFQPFMQADSSTTRRFGGTGLGLVIAKRLANLLGGDVELKESRLGVGTSFAITIDPGPLSAADFHPGEEVVDAKATERQPGEEIRLDGLKILVVDDAPDNRLLISRLLRHAGAEVELATNGGEGVQRALGGSFDVILMDIQMPVVDGYEATSQLRGIGYKQPIIALTAHAMKEELERCRRVGFDRHMPKPVRTRELIASIRHLSAKRAAAKWSN